MLINNSSDFNVGGFFLQEHCSRGRFFGGVAFTQQQQQKQPKTTEVVTSSSKAVKTTRKSEETNRRRMSSSPSSRDDNDDGDNTQLLNAKYGENIYTGAFSKTVKRVKMLSLGSLGATVFGCPLLIELSSGASLDMSSKIVLAGSMSSIGLFTTVMLQWFVNPYVRRLWVDSETKTKVTAEKTSLLLQTYYAKFELKDMGVCESSHPLVTWEANGEKFYVEPASTSEETYKLLELQRFEPDTSKDAPMGYDDDEDDDDDGREKNKNT